MIKLFIHSVTCLLVFNGCQLNSHRKVLSVSVSRPSLELGNYAGYADSFNILAGSRWKLTITPASAGSWLKVDKMNGDTGVTTINISTTTANNVGITDTATIWVNSEQEKGVVASVRLSRAQYGIAWARTFGGSTEDEGSSFIATKDGGYLIFGSTQSKDDDIKSGNKGKSDGWVIKTDSVFNVIWKKRLGGEGSDIIIDAVEGEEEYILVGRVEGGKGDVTMFYGEVDLWIVRMNSSGEIVQEKSYGGPGVDFPSAIISIPEGFIIAGGTFSNGPDNYMYDFECEAWVLKLDKDLKVIWQRVIGGSGFDDFESVVAGPGGGYMLAGFTMSNDRFVEDTKGGADGWLVYMDSTGKIIWKKTIGGNKDDHIINIIRSSDNGYIAIGKSESDKQEFSASHGSHDVWIAKLDLNGEILWQNVYGGSSLDQPHSIAAVSGGYVVSSTTNSSDGDIADNFGMEDIWIIWLDKEGRKLFQQSLGGSNVDFDKKIIVTRDNELIVMGGSFSNDHQILDRVSDEIQAKIWILKLGLK
jgi:hypothetical protein